MISKRYKKLSFGRYMGGKVNLRKWMYNYIPKYRTIVEVFAGGGSFILGLPPYGTEIYNDKWDDLVNYFLQVRDNTEQIVNYMTYMPYSRKLNEDLKKQYNKREFKDDIERAAITYYLMQTNINGVIDASFISTPNKDEAKFLKNHVDGLYELAERMRNVCIENKDFREIVSIYDSETTFFYLDPPYYGTEKYYQQAFTHNDHEDMAKIINNIKGKAMISYYFFDKLLDWYQKDKWSYFSTERVKNSQFGNKTRDKTLEYILVNYDMATKGNNYAKSLYKYL